MPAPFSWIRPEPWGIHIVPADAWIDPSRPVDRALVTHGHADHARGGHGETIATPATLACAGRSYGGYLTLAALVFHPELFAAGVDICGMSDFATFYRDTEPWIATQAYPKYGHPERDSALLRELSPCIESIDCARPCWWFMVKTTRTCHSVKPRKSSRPPAPAASRRTSCSFPEKDTRSCSARTVNTSYARP